ncbi:uncharacterized protein LOC115232463 [Argonauta hians]
MESNKEEIRSTYLMPYITRETVNKMTEKLVKFSLSDIQKERLWPHLSLAARIMGIILSIVGLLASVRWLTSWGNGDSTSPNDMCRADSSDTVCPWKHVFSDFTQRLHLIEMAFKDQVVAREAMAQEVVNQSDLNGVLDQKLSVFINKVEDLHQQIDRVENKILDIHARINSDESVGFLVIVILVIELVMRIHPRIRLLQIWFQEKNLPSSPSSNKQAIDVRRESPSSSSKNGVLNISPKHGISLRNEVCVIMFKKESENIYSTLMDSLIKQLDNVRLAVRPFLAVEGQDCLRHLPYCKIFLVFAECTSNKRPSSPSSPTNSVNQSQMTPSVPAYPTSLQSKPNEQVELQITSLKVIKALGANAIVIITNDEGSKRLSGHVLYNAHLRAIQTQDMLQELASKGRLFSIWKELTSHQISHMRKILLSTLNPRYGSGK